MRKTYSKVNLLLRVYPTIENGYHPINSLVVLNKKIYDEISIKISNGHEIIFENLNPEIQFPLDENNIIYKAITLLNKECPFQKQIKIKIKKSIKPGAGFGLGSSNVAYCIKTLNKRLKLKLTKEKLFEIAAKIGSDVPFFLSGYKAAILSGHGEKVQNIPKNKKIKLKFKINNTESLTKNVYGIYKSVFEWNFSDEVHKYLTNDNTFQFRNDLTDSFLELNPNYEKDIKNGWHLNGSGSSMFRRV